MDNQLLYKLLEETSIQDLPESVQRIAELTGMDNLMKLSQYAGGSKIYIPIPEALVRNARNRNILREYNGYNQRMLAKKYGLTDEQIKRIVKEFDPNQLSIFDIIAEDVK